MADDAGTRVNPTLDRLAAYSWRLIVIGVVAYVALILLTKLAIVVFPLYVALLLTVVLSPIARFLHRRGLPPLVAAWAALLSLFAIIGLAGLLVVPALADEAGDLETTVSQGLDDIEDWVVEDSPFDLSREEVDELRADAGDAAAKIVRDNQDQLISSAVLAFEVVAGAVLALVVTFFFLKDGERFQQFWLRQLPDDQSRATVAACCNRVWATLRGYVMGSAALGLVEAVILSITLTIVGARLIVPVAVLTFLAAFIPFVGALTAGIVAVLVALVTAGPGAAIVVGIVALVVQQFDNDLLAPIVFGKALDLHPLLILLSITAFGSLGGVAGAFLAVPVTASALNAFGVWREMHLAREPEPLASG